VPKKTKFGQLKVETVDDLPDQNSKTMYFNNSCHLDTIPAGPADVNKIIFVDTVDID
jgi:hypothetical protein